MLRSSLTLRLIVAMIVSLMVLIPLISISLEEAFKSSLETSLKKRLQSQLYFLIAELEVDDSNLYMPELVADETLNQLSSGTYAYINSKDLALWQSRSSALLNIAEQLPQTHSGDEFFEVQRIEEDDFYRLSLTVLFDVYEQEQPFSFHVIYEKKLLDTDVASFRKNLWLWMSIITLVLLVIQLWWLYMALSPMREIRAQINMIEQGKQEQIGGKFPSELKPITNSINRLISTEIQQRTRYKNSLSDLAHALKTPLAILKGQQLNSDGEEQIQRINQMIERQLKRAASSGEASWHLGIQVLPEIEKLVAAMQKIYREKQLLIELDIDDRALFYGDQADFMELSGNLIDNACKAAQSKVKIAVSQDEAGLRFYVDDDGKGVAEKDREKLLQRGTRLDTYEQGHGIGLAIVKDLVMSYQGKLDIETSSLGGARFAVRFRR